MHTARYSHAAVYHSQYLYVLAGVSADYLRECERYVCAESRWEELPALPVAGFAMSTVVMDNSLFALGGQAGGDLDTVQRLCFDSLTWELMQLELPLPTSDFPCFKAGTQVFFLIYRTLYSFTPVQVHPIKTLDRGVSWCEASYYSRGTLYISSGKHGITSKAVGELTSL
jgi:hypothetical protein